MSITCTEGYALFRSTTTLANGVILFTKEKKKKQCNPGTISHSYHKNRIKARVVQHSLNNSLGAWGLLSSSAYNSVLRTYGVYSSLDTSQILILVHLSWLRSYPPSNMHACPEYVLCTVQPTERPVLTDQ